MELQGYILCKILRQGKGGGNGMAVGGRNLKRGNEEKISTLGPGLGKIIEMHNIYPCVNKKKENHIDLTYKVYIPTLMGCVPHTLGSV